MPAATPTATHADLRRLTERVREVDPERLRAWAATLKAWAPITVLLTIVITYSPDCSSVLLA